MARLNANFARVQQRVSALERENSKLREAVRSSEEEKNLYVHRWQRAVQKIRDEENLKRKIQELQSQS